MSCLLTLPDNSTWGWIRSTLDPSAERKYSEGNCYILAQELASITDGWDIYTFTQKPGLPANNHAFNLKGDFVVDIYGLWQLNDFLEAHSDKQGLRAVKDVSEFDYWSVWGYPQIPDYIMCNEHLKDKLHSDARLIASSIKSTFDL